VLRLTSLAPDTIEAILRGDEPDGLSLEKLQKPALSAAEGPVLSGAEGPVLSGAEGNLLVLRSKLLRRVVPVRWEEQRRGSDATGKR
jgi:hypothetical protein